MNKKSTSKPAASSPLSPLEQIGLRVVAFEDGLFLVRDFRGAEEVEEGRLIIKLDGQHEIFVSATIDQLLSKLMGS